jgi:hypothetical protein
MGMLGRMGILYQIVFIAAAGKQQQKCQQKTKFFHTLHSFSPEFYTKFPINATIAHSKPGVLQDFATPPVKVLILQW